MKKVAFLLSSLSVFLLDGGVSGLAQHVGILGAATNRTSRMFMMELPGPGCCVFYASTNLVKWQVRKLMESGLGIRYTWSEKTPGQAEFYRSVYWPEVVWSSVPLDVRVTVGQPFTLHGEAMGYSNLRYEWYQAGDPLVMRATTQTLSVAKATLSDAGTYLLSARVGDASFGCPIRAEVTVVDNGDWAPLDLAGMTLDATITFGASPFRSSGEFTMVFSDSTYELNGGIGIPDSIGSYTYDRKSATSAWVYWDDALLGPGKSILTWAGPTSGTFQQFRDEGGAQSGSFNISR